MSNEDFTTFKNGDLTKEEVIAKYHKSRIEGYIRREFANPNRRATTQSLIESSMPVPLLFHHPMVTTTLANAETMMI